jgi:hypothetical protein
MPTDGHKASGNADNFLGLTVFLQAGILFLQERGIGRDLITVAKRSHTQFLKGLHLLPTHLHKGAQILRGLSLWLILLLICHL